MTGVMSLITDFFNPIYSNFVSTNLRTGATFDPVGFTFVIMTCMLVIGLASSLYLRLTHPEWMESQVSQARANMEKNYMEMTTEVELARENFHKNLAGVTKDVADAKFKMEQNLTVMSKFAAKEGARQGFVVEMLSFAYLSRLAFAVIFFGLASYLNALSAVIAGWRTPNIVVLNLDNNDSGEKTLPDLGHDTFKFVMGLISSNNTTYIERFELPDEFIFYCATITITMIVFHPRRLLILRRVLSIFAFINLCRACCVFATSLPDASPMCVSQFNTDRGLYKAKPIFPTAFFRAWKVLTRPSNHITCGDMVFSGHTVFLVLCGMIVRTYATLEELNTPFIRKRPYVLPLLRYSVYIGIGCGIFTIIGTKLHYTLDVLIATFITFQSWLVYHWEAHGYISDSKIIAWLEHKEVSVIDSSAYKIARRSSSCSVKSEADDRVVRMTTRSRSRAASKKNI